jgi:hypothetical protein
MGQVDGVWLDQFNVGEEYDLATSLAICLVTTHCAELADSEVAQGNIGHLHGPRLGIFMGTQRPMPMCA